MTTRVAKVFDATLTFSPSSVPAQKTALLLLDYQYLTVSQLGGTGASTVEIAQHLQTWAETNDISVFHCIVDTNDNPVPTSKIASRWSRYESMIKQNPEVGLEVAELATSSSETTFRRRPGLVSALSSPGILQALQDKDIRSLLLGGLSTSGCLLSTARAATDQGFIATVVEDACCDLVPELHDMLVKHVLPMTAHVARSAEVMEMWKGSI